MALSWFGDRLSYAFYLWHGEVFALAMVTAVMLGLRADPWVLPIAFVFAVAIAALSAFAVERPVMRAAALWIGRLRADAPNPDAALVDGGRGVADRTAATGVLEHAHLEVVGRDE